MGLRSTSADDARYSNADVIVPYSNWRGPMWVNINELAAYGHRTLAIDIGTLARSPPICEAPASGTRPTRPPKAARRSPPLAFSRGTRFTVACYDL